MPNTTRIPLADVLAARALYVIALPLLAIGDVVVYHGSQPSEHGEEFVVIGATNGRLGLMHRRGGYSMSNVRRTSVTPTGDVADMCEHCGHPAEDEHCVRATCDCRHGAPMTFAEQFDAIATGTEQVIRANDGTPVSVMLSAAEYVRLLEQVR
ncbi:hypothetical protein [Nocardia cerradoensis]|uniref:Uncharacterized protein n=1 Tax=Nocardia cerradoensis TaxID=85688 RepID=A0A231GTN9_9NOCA|nr:hypothetical protein [Nocardia cerradoensis]NKY48001.1 hypothetical protein [Nocardia cerradoensis]OXR39915.1 hypothetical protein B7C42_08020 [Nocardia cerradoensis]